MLRQEKLNFIKDMSNLELSPAFLRELGKSKETGKKTLGATNLFSNVSAFECRRRSGGRSKSPASLHSYLRTEEKLKSFPDRLACLSPLVVALRSVICSSVAQGSTDEQAAAGTRQLSTTKGGQPYAAVVAGRADLQQPSGPHKPLAEGSDHSVSAASI